MPDATPYSDRPRQMGDRLSRHYEGVDSNVKRLWALIVQLSILLREENIPKMRETDSNLTRGEIIVLTALRAGPAPYELRQTDITDRVHMSSGGVTNVCKKLVKRGWIRRSKDATDARVTLYRLTSDGIELINQIIPIIHGTEMEFSACLTRQELLSLCELLERVTARFN